MRSRPALEGDLRMEDGEMAGLPATSTNRKEEKRARQVSLYADRSFARGVAVQWCVSGRQSEESAAADAQATPLTVETRDYGGFEKVGALEAVLPAEGRQTAARSSDIALYQGEQIVVFYGSNLWKYTRRGRTDALVGMEEALGDGGIAMTFSQREERRLAEWRGASAALRSPNARASFTSASFLFVITFVEEIEGVHTTIQLIIEEW